MGWLVVSSVENRRTRIEPKAVIPLVRQCELAGVSRATVYAQRVPKPASESDLELLRLIDEQYTRRPFYGSRKMVAYLKVQDHRVNRKRVQRLMRILGLAGMAPGPATSQPHPQHKVYPYLFAAWWWRDRTRCGARTSPTFGSAVASST